MADFYIRRAAWALAAIYAGVFLYYSLTHAYHYDEAYHLLTAQLIVGGKRPYLDFCFPQTPLNAYLNAFWMLLFGQSWRVIHLIAVLYTLGAIGVVSAFVWRRFGVGAALVAAVTMGLNPFVFQYGPLAQPYGICLLALAVAYWIALLAVEREGVLPAGLAGLVAGTAASSSLLSAAAGPVVLGWMLIYNRAGSRWRKGAAFVAGAAIPFLPVVRLFLLGPRETWFNLFQYHAYFRRLYWPHTTRHDLEVLTSWIYSVSAMVIGVLAFWGLVWIVRHSGWAAERKAEFYLCGWLAAGVAAEVGAAHPTFPQYFVLTVPFLTILAVVGLNAIGRRAAIAVVMAAYVFGLGQALWDDRDSNTWAYYEQVAAKVQEVTPPGAKMFALEPVYFLTKRTPPPGLELSYTHELPLSPAEEKLFHIVSDAEIKKMIATEDFPTAVIDEDWQIEAYGLKDVYAQHVVIEDQVEIYWGRKR